MYWKSDTLHLVENSSVGKLQDIFLFNFTNLSIFYFYFIIFDERCQINVYCQIAVYLNGKFSPGFNIFIFFMITVPHPDSPGKTVRIRLKYGEFDVHVTFEIERN